MSLVPAVTELMMAELLYLEYESATKPINIYINSTGVTVRPSPGPLKLRLSILPAFVSSRRLDSEHAPGTPSCWAQRPCSWRRRLRLCHQMHNTHLCR